MDSENCINAISSKSLENLGLEVVPHPHPFKVSWIDSTTLEVKQQCLVPVNFNHYKKNIWCDVITMNVGQVTLGRPWLFDKNVIIYSRSNMCQLEHEGKQIKLPPFRSTNGQWTTQANIHFGFATNSTFFTSYCYCSLPISHYHAYFVRKLLPPLLQTPSHYTAFKSKSAFASHKHVHKLYKEISDENK